MRRLIACGSLLLALALPIKAGEEPPPPRTPRIAVVKSADIANYDISVDGFHQAIDADITVHTLHRRRWRTSRIMRRVRTEKPDLVFALGTRAALTSREAFPATPMVFSMVIGWEERGLTGENLAGVAFEIPPDILFTQLRIAAPNLRSIGVIHTPRNTKRVVDEARAAAAGRDITLRVEAVESAGEARAAYANLVEAGIDALWLIADPVLTPENFQFLMDQTGKSKIPVISYSPAFVEQGALLSISPDYTSIGAQAASLARRIVEEQQDPGALGVAPPVGTNLVVNAGVAEQLGHSMSPFVLRMADRVIGAE